MAYACRAYQRGVRLVANNQLVGSERSVLPPNFQKSLLLVDLEIMALRKVESTGLSIVREVK